MAQQNVKYGYMAVEMRPTSTGETTKILQEMNKLGDGGYRFVTVFHLPPDQAFILWSNSATLAKANGLNLTNEVFGFYQGSPIYPIQREYYKPTIGAGLRWNSVEHN